MFQYEFADEEVDEYFSETCNICFKLLPEANRIVQLVKNEHGGAESFGRRLYGDEEVSALDLCDAMNAYLVDLKLSDKAEVRLVDDMFSAASVVKPSTQGKYVVRIKNCPCSLTMIQGICDHELGTHLLRMVNNETQVWHRARPRFNLANPWITEEGLATLNTYMTLPTKLMYPQAFSYFATCRAARIGFAELFHEVQAHLNDAERSWILCCRVKRGLRDTSQPGASYLGQAYFKGAVEILQNLNNIDLATLYSGQLALQDVKRVSYLVRRDLVRLPPFLRSDRKFKSYWDHCVELVRVNQIQVAVHTVHRPISWCVARKEAPLVILNHLTARDGLERSAALARAQVPQRPATSGGWRRLRSSKPTPHASGSTRVKRPVPRCTGHARALISVGAAQPKKRSPC